MSSEQENSPKSESLIGRLRRRCARHLLAVRQRVRVSQEAVHLFLAGVVGLLGGVINVAFVSASDFLGEWLLGPSSAAAAEGGPWWSVLAVTAGGGLLAGLSLALGLRYVVRTGSSNFLEAVFLGNGCLPLRSALVKGLSSFLSIVSGASIGREGSITQLTATLASRWGQLYKWAPYRLRLLVACGAASGMAAAYNAPIAGAVFAAHIVLGNFAMNLFAPLVFASVVATMVSRSVFGQGPLYDVPTFSFAVQELPWFLGLGLLCGVAAAGFQKALRLAERAFEVTGLPIAIRLMVGGVIVGVLALWFPGVVGNGYAEANQVLRGDLAFQALLGLSLARLLATVMVVGAGTLGGVFTPTLFLGAGLGGLLFFGAEGLGVSMDMPMGAFALVGMGGLLAGTTHSPLLAMIMLFELTLNYALMPPLMLTCVVSTLVARSWHPPNVYSEGLELKGLASSWETEREGAATRRRIGDLMLAPVPPLRDVDSFDRIAERFIKSTVHFLPVVNGAERLIGVVALQDMKEYLTMGDHLKSVIALDVMRPPPEVLTPDLRLDEALGILLSSELMNVPVVASRRDMKLIGSVVRIEALGLLSEAIATKVPGSQS